MREYKLNSECERFITHLKRERWANNTCLAYTIDLCLLFETFPVSPLEITKQQIEEYLYKSKSESTFRRRKASLTKAFKYFQINDIRKDNPMDSVGTMKQNQKSDPLFLSPDELKKLKKVVNKSGNLRSIAMMSVFINLGLRESEVRNLDRHNLQDGFLAILESKGGKSRVIPVPDSTIADIKMYLDSRNDNNPAMFVSRDLLRCSRSTIVNIVKGFYKLIGKGDIGLTPHSLRHSAATGYILAGMDIVFAGEMLGHQSISTTKLYTHIVSSELQKRSVDLL